MAWCFTVRKATFGGLRAAIWSWFLVGSDVAKATLWGLEGSNLELPVQKATLGTGSGRPKAEGSRSRGFRPA